MQEDVARTVSQDCRCFRPLVCQLGFFKTFMSAVPFCSCICRNLDSPKKKRKFDVKSHSLNLSYWIKCCTGLHRKGNTIHILIFNGIDGGYIDRTELKLFKGRRSWFDIVECSK